MKPCKDCDLYEWTKCSERLPEDFIRVLGWNRDYAMVCYVDHKNLDDNGKPSWWMCLGREWEFDDKLLVFEEDYPTHWQPLPAAPQEEATK